MDSDCIVCGKRTLGPFEKYCSTRCKRNDERDTEDENAAIRSRQPRRDVSRD